MYIKFFKRLFDILISTIGIIVLALPMLFVAIAVKADSKGPVFFKQKRIGIHKKTFMILKFRSMPVTAPHDTPTHQFDPSYKLSGFQHAIRRLSIDELPQLYNIWLGQMSFIGPRPALWNQYDLIAERDKYGANDVKPGLTGWAQINGRDELEIPVKAKLDGDYVRMLNTSGFRTDWKCFWRSIGVVIGHKGVSEGGAYETEKEETASEKEEIKG